MIDSTLTGLESHQFQHHSSWAFLTCEALKRLHCQVNKLILITKLMPQKDLLPSRAF